jgi:chromate transporter
LIGWRVASWPGALVATVTKFGPSSIVTAFALRVWRRYKDAPWRSIVQMGLVPMTVGLVAASAALIVRASDHSWGLAVITAVVTLVTLTTRVHPLWMLAAGAVLGLSGIGQP